MKVLILAGGYGTRISEETVRLPKPMIDIGSNPILWHIMKIYSAYNFHEFVILLGYKGYVIKEYFANYFLHQSNVTIDLERNDLVIHNTTSEPWKVTLVDTGLKTLTGGRVKRAKPFIDGRPFMLTYGDGVGNVNIDELVRFHKSHGRLVTITSVQPEGRFGTLDIEDDNRVTSFFEKPKTNGVWINAGFFVCEPEVIDMIQHEETSSFEKETLRHLSEIGEVRTYKHRGFWRPMDTLRDKMMLTELWKSGEAPWKTW